MRWITAYLDGRLVLALAQIDDMPEWAVRCPLGVADLDHHLGSAGRPIRDLPPALYKQMAPLSAFGALVFQGSGSPQRDQS